MNNISSPLPLPARRQDSHKGDFGRVLLVGGSPGMAGSIALSGMAALRGGAGLVTIAAPASTVGIVASFDPCYMTLAISEDSSGIMNDTANEQLQDLLQAATSVGIGPGLGRSAALDRLVLKWYETIEQPLVIDADGLNALAGADDLQQIPHAPIRVLTPHPGEFLRLADRSFANRKEMESAASEYARLHKVIVVLKGHHSLVTDGYRSEYNTTGNPGMATGGAGDVLTGLICALTAQCTGMSQRAESSPNQDAFEAVRLAVHVHGLAGDLAARRLGQVSVTAADICQSLGPALQTFNESLSQAGRQKE